MFHKYQVGCQMDWKSVYCSAVTIMNKAKR